MRDIFVTVVVFGFLPVILMRPYVGVLVWSWLAFMNPHRLTWGFAYTMQFSLMVAVTTLVALFISREPKRIPWTRETILLLFFIVWMFLSTLAANYPGLAWPQWDKVWRIMLMTYVTLMLINSQFRLHLLVTVTTLSLAFYGVKGGIFVLTGGSAHSVMGPAGSFLGDRNSVALALLMTIPLLRYLQLQATQKWYGLALMAAIPLTLVAVVGTHSRGALVGLAATLTFFLLKSRNRAGLLILLIPLGLTVLYVMPQEWFERMQTIETYEEDASAQGRIYAWGNAITLANENFLGGGFRALAGYGGTDSHSNYFGVLGEQGWIGLAMFLLLHLFVWQSASWVVRRSRKHRELYWARDLAAMIQVSLVAYMSAGAFLGLQWFDLFYHLIAIIVVTRMLVAQKLSELENIAVAPRGESVTVAGDPSSVANGPGAVTQRGGLNAGKAAPARPVRPFVRTEE